MSIKNIFLFACVIFSLTCHAENTTPSNPPPPVLEQPKSQNTQTTEPQPAVIDNQSSTATTSTDRGFFGHQWDNFTSTFLAKDSELYIPAHTWHNRAMYAPENIKRENEDPWGIGYGKYRYDSDGDMYMVCAMVFLDSHKKVEPLFGYAFEKIWRPTQNWRFGAGITAALTSRKDYSNYLQPIPALLPIVSVSYGKLSIDSTYIPGRKGNGNVLFTWLRWQL